MDITTRLPDISQEKITAYKIADEKLTHSITNILIIIKERPLILLHYYATQLFHHLGNLAILLRSPQYVLHALEQQP